MIKQLLLLAVTALTCQAAELSAVPSQISGFGGQVIIQADGSIKLQTADGTPIQAFGSAAGFYSGPIILGSLSTPGVSASGQANLYFNGTSLKVSLNGGGYADLGGSSFDQSAVAITGGTIAGTPISGSTGSFTTLSFPEAGGTYPAISASASQELKISTVVGDVKICRAGVGDANFPMPLAGAGWANSLRIGDFAVGAWGSLGSYLVPAAANTLALRNGANAQTFAMGPATTDGVLIKQSAGGAVSLRNGNDSAGATVTAGAFVGDGATIGAGATLDKVIIASNQAVSASAAANAYNAVDLSIAGVDVGDFVSVTLRTSLSNDLVLANWSVSTGSLRLNFYNANPASIGGTWSGNADVIVFKAH